MLYSNSMYDSLGNVYTVEAEYDHLPTAQDSADFQKESQIEIRKMMDSASNN